MFSTISSPSHPDPPSDRHVTHGSPLTFACLHWLQVVKFLETRSIGVSLPNSFQHHPISTSSIEIQSSRIRSLPARLSALFASSKRFSAHSRGNWIPLILLAGLGHLSRLVSCRLRLTMAAIGSGTFSRVSTPLFLPRPCTCFSTRPNVSSSCTMPRRVEYAFTQITPERNRTRGRQRRAHTRYL